jgi:hypothetical protein
MDESYSRHGEQKNMLCTSGGKVKRKEPLGRTRHRWEGND